MKSYDQYSKLFKVGQIITSQIDFDTLFDVIIKQTNTIMNCERCSIFLLDDNKEMLSAFASAGIGGLSIQISKSKGIVGWVFTNQKPAIVNNVHNDERFDAAIDKKSGLQTNNILCVPLINRNKVCIGALEIINSQDGDFTESDLEILMHLSNYITIALENAKLYRELGMMDKAKERVIAHLSHELRTPISLLSAIITSFAKTLKKYEKEKAEKFQTMGKRHIQRLMDIEMKVNDIVTFRPNEQKEFLINLINEAANIVDDLAEEQGDNKNHILKTIHDRIESVYKVGKPKFENIDLKNFIKSLIEEVVSQSFRPQIDIDIDIDKNADSHLTIYTDKKILRKIVIGLLKNAMENTPDEGKIKIKVYATKKSIVIDCIDHGVGITRKNQQHIFGGFYHTQETNGYSTKQPFAFNAGGAGIDLLSARILSEKLGFKISLSSKRCDFILLDSDQCPGRISLCKHITDKNECYLSGGSTFSLIFP